MSWQAYVDQSIVSAGGAHRAAIVSLASPHGVWATSQGFQPQPQELQQIAANLANPANFAATGITVAGQKYVFLRNADNLVMGKKGAGGITIAKSDQAIIIAVYDEGIPPGASAKVVGALADYLKSQGY